MFSKSVCPQHVFKMIGWISLYFLSLSLETSAVGQKVSVAAARSCCRSSDATADKAQKGQAGLRPDTLCLST